jgi:hypothetical protein
MDVADGLELDAWSTPGPIVRSVRQFELCLLRRSGCVCDHP